MLRKEKVALCSFLLWINVMNTLLTNQINISHLAKYTSINYILCYPQKSQGRKASQDIIIHVL